MNTPELLLPEQYVKDATNHIKRARQHIYLLTMIINDDEKTEKLFQAIQEAAERGVIVHFVADTYTYTELGGHIRFNTYYSKRIRGVASMRKRMERAGAHFHWLGSNAVSLVTGRTHSKWLIVDDIVYSFGGTNLYKAGLESTDFMFKIKDIGLATRFIAEQSRIVLADKRGHAFRSHKFTEGDFTVLFDGGFFGDSLIYRRACALSELAKEITYVSQYCPTGKLGRILRKKEATLYFNPWDQAESLNSLVIRLGSRVSGNKTSYIRKKYIHAKYMLFEMENGEKIALTGSHNFSHGGVWLGTKEVALETNDTQVVRELERFTRKFIA
jgi:cardiolipin synthase